jgi:hypothetical protein
VLSVYRVLKATLLLSRMVQSVPLARSAIPIQLGTESARAAAEPTADKRAGWGR